MSDDLPERASGKLGESAGETLMRALDNIGRLESESHGASVERVIVLYSVKHPPDDDDDLTGTTYGSDYTPGMGVHEVVGMLRYWEHIELNA